VAFKETSQDLPSVATEWSGRRAYFEDEVPGLYERDAPQEQILRRIGQYVRRWKRWVFSGVREISAQIVV
jgi:hypothetical protein